MKFDFQRLFTEDSHQIWYQFFIERKFRENEVENASKFAKILNENEEISFIHFREFHSTKISMETLHKMSWKTYKKRIDQSLNFLWHFFIDLEKKLYMMQKKVIWTVGPVNN